MEQTVFYSSAKLLVLLHAVAAAVLVGASTHHSVVTVGYIRRRYNLRLGRIYAATVAAAYVVTLGLGSLAYPTYRYHVRGLYLDRHAVWASNLFDIKENCATIGLPLAIGAFVLSRIFHPKEDRPLLLGYALMVFLATGIVWFTTISGLLITQVKGV
jgi:hypothetical protein